jgi:hypothetical protein
MSKRCKCGCGTRVRKRFVKGHNRLYDLGLTQETIFTMQSLADKYNVCLGTIHKVITKKGYANV